MLALVSDRVACEAEEVIIRLKLFILPHFQPMTRMVHTYIRGCPYIRTCKMGLQSSAEELMYTMPFLDTVAGEALSML